MLLLFFSAPAHYSLVATLFKPARPSIAVASHAALPAAPVVATTAAPAAPQAVAFAEAPPDATLH